MELQREGTPRISPDQALLGFLWSVLYSDVMKCAWAAHRSAVTWLSLDSVKWIYTIGSTVWLIYGVHGLVAWNRQVVSIEEIASPETPASEFVIRFARTLWPATVALIAWAILTVFPYFLFPSTIDKYVITFASLLWPMWILGKFGLMFRSTMVHPNSDIPPSGGGGQTPGAVASHSTGPIGVMMLLLIAFVLLLVPLLRKLRSRLRA